MTLAFLFPILSVFTKIITFNKRFEAEKLKRYLNTTINHSLIFINKIILSYKNLLTFQQVYIYTMFVDLSTRRSDERKI